jgi:hypothetical protein
MLKQVEDRISGLKNKVDRREKTEKYTGEEMKEYERNMQNSATPLKEHTYKSQALKEKSQKHRKHIQENNSRKIPKS